MTKSECSMAQGERPVLSPGLRSQANRQEAAAGGSAGTVREAANPNSEDQRFMNELFQ
jgi:hypothetical protein